MNLVSISMGFINLFGRQFKCRHALPCSGVHFITHCNCIKFQLSSFLTKLFLGKSEVLNRIIVSYHIIKIIVALSESTFCVLALSPRPPWDQPTWIRPPNLRRRSPQLFGGCAAWFFQNVFLEEQTRPKISTESSIWTPIYRLTCY